MCLIFFLLVFEAEKKKVLLCGAAGAGAGRGPGLAGGQDLGGIPRPHRVTWSRPINVHPGKARERAEKPAGA